MCPQLEGDCSERSAFECNMTTVILASSSPRRKELMALTGWQVILRAVDVDEAPLPHEPAGSVAHRLAVAKARLAAEQEGQGEIVLAADTVVAKADRILGKPLDQTEAHRMLMDLRAQSHQVITALMLIGDGQEAIEICETTVPMRDYGPKEVSEYVATGSPLDKAGAYGIQDSGFDPVAVEKMEGCFANVMGLPLCHLVRAMRGLGQTPEADVPLACQAHTGYDCPVYPEILRGVA